MKGETLQDAKRLRPFLSLSSFYFYLFFWGGGILTFYLSIINYYFLSINIFSNTLAKVEKITKITSLCLIFLTIRVKGI